MAQRGNIQWGSVISGALKITAVAVAATAAGAFFGAADGKGIEAVKNLFTPENLTELTTNIGNSWNTLGDYAKRAFEGVINTGKAVFEGFVQDKVADIDIVTGTTKDNVASMIGNTINDNKLAAAAVGGGATVLAAGMVGKAAEKKAVGPHTRRQLEARQRAAMMQAQGPQHG